MAALNFLCPKCNARLRLNDRKLIGRQIPCPECSSQLELFESDLGEVDVRLIAETPATPESKTEQPVSREPNVESPSRKLAVPSLSQKFAGLTKPLQTPMGVAWCLAISLTMLFIFAVLLPELNDQSRTAVAEAHKDPSKRSGQQLPVDNRGKTKNGTAKQSTKDTSRTSARNDQNQNKRNGTDSDSTNGNTTTPTKITNVIQQSPVETDQKTTKDKTTTIAQTDTNTQKSTDNDANQNPKPEIPEVEEPKVELDIVLKLPIIKFEQKTPVPAARLLLQLENLSGVSFNTDALTRSNAEWKTREVTLELENVSFEDLLTEVVSKLDATWEAKDGAIIVLPATASANSETVNTSGNES